MDDTACPVLNRVEQQRNFGIDCGDEILFAAGAWAPGGEHTKKLHVKNVSNRTLKLKYDLPRTKYFSMDFPVLITLSPGTSRILDIAFRPVQYEEYDDFIRVHVHIIDGGVKATSGSFRLPVKARISMLNTSIPNGIDFGFCPTADTTEFKFTLKNTGQIDATFQWTLPDAGEHGRPFSIKPPMGEVKAGQSLDMIATFSPLTASVYVVTARFVAHELGETHQHQEKTMKISGIGKYAYFAASESELDFGDLLVGASANHKHPTEKEFVLRNRSLVRAGFQIVPVESDHEPLFFFSPLKGVIPPEAHVAITVKYTPLSPGTFTCDNFHIKTPGGHTVRITCRGKAVGPLLTLWKKNLASNLIKGNSINFKDVPVGNISTRVLILKNESDVAVRFNFMAAPNGVFTMDKVTGIVPPLLETAIMLSFTPEAPGNFYRRLFILVQNQSTIYVDVLGTGYDNEIRPSPFQQAHVDAYRLRCQHHWGHLSPDGLEALLEEKGDTYFLHGALRAAMEAIAETRMLTRSGESLLSDVAISEEFFHMGTDRTNAIIVSETLLEFGSHGSKKTLIVTNQTRGKVTCAWRISEENSTPNANFRISPASCDIAPGASAEFVVNFDPQNTNTYYFAELESHVYFKSNRTFRLVNPETFTPPWCVVVHASGHTFGSSESQFLSKVTFLTAKDSLCPFPPAHLGDSVFQTVSLQNASDTPALFSVVQDPSEVFWVHPPSGLIPANGFHLVQIRFTPNHPRRYHYRLKTVVNYVSSVFLDLTGMGCRPQLVCLDAQTQPIDKIYIKPTAIGLSSTRFFHVHNPSRVPLVFRWQLPASLQSTFQLSPLVHRLWGNESQMITCVFSPSQLKQYNQRVSVHVKSISKGVGDKSNAATLVQETSVKLFGVGTTGAVSFVPTILELPTVLVNSPTSLPFHIVNSSDCDLKFELRVICRSQTTEANAANSHENADCREYISFSKPRGVIGARSQQKIEITFRANLAGTFGYDIACAVATVDMNQFLADSESVKMSVEASASFPTLVVEDIRLLQTSTATGWSQFQVEPINKFLMAPLTKEELRFNAESSPDLSTLTSFHLQFTPAVHGSSTEEAWVQLRNPGSLVVTFRIYYPNESDVELEPWADRGEPTAEELRQNIIIDSKLFTITPRTGVLQPHQSLVLSISYAYSSMQYEGIHDLPIMLNVAQGKKLTLVLNGRTLPPSTPHLFIPNLTSTLSPIMLGESTRKTHQFCKPVLQQIPLFNAGDRPLKIDVDDSALAYLNANQFNFPLLECLTTHLVLPAHSTAYLDVEFCPLEDKTHTADLFLYADGIDTDYSESKTITVVARGYHPTHHSFADMHTQPGGPPTKQLVQQQMPITAVLSQDRMDFGLVSVRTDNCRIVLLINPSATATLSFAWDESHPLVQMKRVRFSPSQGKLPPHQHVVVRVTLVAQDDLRVVDQDIPCWVRVLSDTNTLSSTNSPKSNKTSTTAETKSSTASEAPSTRPSVITRSTISSRSHVNRTTATDTKTSSSSSNKSQSTPSTPKTGGKGTKKNKWRLSGGSLDSELTTLTPPLPIYLHIFAHIVPIEVFRRQYSPADFNRHPLALPTSDVRFVDQLSSLRQRWGFQDPKSAKESRHVIEGVMGFLLLDLLNSGAVAQAMDELPKEPPTPCFVQFRSTLSTRKAQKAQRRKQNDDLKRLTSTVLENTIFNLIQEIACGDFDLSCLPKQLIFNPTIDDDEEDNPVKVV
ncbi:Aste57867_2382 [Aphanomyces stellatus]|uniref:Aste57867_2382 protein n=1 Tax=Aphanomyces stellatus TaxID=120398 RepID=A0A485KCM2_9STRA|nr:hypothetical protein As57867_002376 [Aphanomyces stellatus]VFT79583.1 Aste57867_2382 [Aphanomyces stellatus]